MTLAVPETQLAVKVHEDPEIVLARTTKQADALMRVVEEKGMFATIENKKYLEVEAWQLVAAFVMVHPIPRAPVALFNDGQIYAYECTCDIFQDGEIIGAGTSICGLDAFTSKDRTGTDQHKAAQSTAQTWSVSKAMRNTYGFVAKLAGYEATTAEEMRTGGGAVGGGGSTSDPMYFCPLHEKE